MPVTPAWLSAIQRLRRRYRGLGLGLACAGLAWALTSLPFARGLEDWIFDGAFYYRDYGGPRPSHAREGIVIIGLDAASLREIKKPLIYISPELAEVTRYCLAQHAAAVGIDFMIPADKSDDPAICCPGGAGFGKPMREVAASGRVVLPMRCEDPLMPIPQWWIPRPLERSETTEFGFTELNVENDQFVRRQKLLKGEGAELSPQFALALYAKCFPHPQPITRHPTTGAPRVGDRVIPIDSEGLMRINFVGPPGSISVIPFREALAAARAGSPIEVRNAAVIIGVTDRSLQDYHSTPYSNLYARCESSSASDRMSGVELQANIFATISDGAYITTPWQLNRGILLVVFGAALGVAFARLSLEMGFVLAVIHHFAWKALAVSALAQGVRIEVVAVLTLGALAYATTFVRRWWKLRRMFGVVKSEEVIRALEADEERLDPVGEERIVTVLFADIRRFTDFSEKHSPMQVVALQRAYFAAVVPCIENAGGTVVCYMGDGIMALFGAPASQPDHAARAVRAVTAMIRAVHDLKAPWSKLDAEGAWREQGGLRIGAGLHTGPVVVGAIGSPGRLDYSATGDVVNAAARLESATKDFGGEVLVSKETLGRVPREDREKLKLGEPILVKLKGKELPIKAYPLFAE